MALVTTRSYFYYSTTSLPSTSASIGTALHFVIVNEAGGNLGMTY